MTTEIDTTKGPRATTGTAKRERKPRGPSKLNESAVSDAMAKLEGAVGDGAAVEILADKRLLVYGPGGVHRTDGPIKGKAAQIAFLTGAAFGLRLGRGGETV